MSDIGKSMSPAAAPPTTRIVVVDDESSVARFVGRLLELNGFEVELHMDSERVLELFKANAGHADLIISDQTMPKMTGVELIERLRVLNPALPVILFTGFSDAVSQAQVDGWGNSAYMTKPLDPPHLIATVRALVGSA